MAAAISTSISGDVSFPKRGTIAPALDAILGSSFEDAFFILIAFCFFVSCFLANNEDAGL